MLTWEEYLQIFDPIIEGKVTRPPYDNSAYIEYTVLNKARMNRWLKTGKLLDEANSVIALIDSPQKWFLITEAWCGDAAHSTPFIYMLSQLNSNIELRLIIRDEEPDWINKYPTDGNRSIPKLIVRDKNDKDLFTWGARPAACEAQIIKMNSDGVEKAEAKKITQQWYNNDKGHSAQREILELISRHIGTRS